MRLKLLALLITITAGAAFAGGTAAAASIYDDVYQTIGLEDLNVQRKNYYTTTDCAPQNVGIDWAQYILDSDKWLPGRDYSDVRDSFNSAVDSGAWGVSVYGAVEGTQGGEARYMQTILIYWTETRGLNLGWAPTNVQLPTVKWGRIGYRVTASPNCDLFFNAGNSSPPAPVQENAGLALSNNKPITTNPSSTWIRNFFISYFNPNYPVDYEGESIKDSPALPPTVLSDTPAIQLVSLGNFKFEFYDNNFVNYQINEVPFYCGVTIPDVIWQIIDDNAAIIMSGHFKANNKAEFQHTPSQLDETYTLYATYDCPDDPQIEFDTGVQIPYSTSSNGWLAAPTWNTCIVDGFPWVDVQECLNNLTRVIDTLSFGTMRVNNPDAWVVSEVCYNTTTLHTWLGSDATFQLCPQFSEEIRNIVTPFVTFLLGLLTITFITKRTGSGFNG